MAQINPYYQSLKREYIFPVIERKLAELKANCPQAHILNFGIGDIALPLAPAIIQAINEATLEMGEKHSMRGYGPTEGYAFLREAICKNEFSHLGLSHQEIFISDGANSDTANILEIFSPSNLIAIPNPTYPVYLDSSILAGRKSKITLLPCNKETGFLPKPPDFHCDLIYLCSPSNPTGVAMTKKELKAWTDYAHREKAIILFDHAYETFVSSPEVPKSIFEIEGAKEVAIEFRSFSKSAGFTGLRCGYTVLPKTVKGYLRKKPFSLHSLWDRRQSTKTNGVSYPIQKGALAVFSEEGRKQTQAQVSFYLQQAKTLREGLLSLGHFCVGGIDSPYIWWRIPSNMKSWEFFDLLLHKCHLISIPGVGFGTEGEGYIRLSAFTTPGAVQEALNRIQKLNTTTA
jgi:LL-diaminopimelate aminotransferase